MDPYVSLFSSFSPTVTVDKLASSSMGRQRSTRRGQQWQRRPKDELERLSVSATMVDDDMVIRGPLVPPLHSHPQPLVPPPIPAIMSSTRLPHADVAVSMLGCAPPTTTSSY